MGKIFKDKFMIAIMIIIIVILIAMYMSRKPDLPKLPEKVEIKDKNVPNYTAHHIGNKGTAYYNIDRVVNVIGGKLMEVDLKGKTLPFDQIIVESKTNSILYTGSLACDLKFYTKDAGIVSYDVCGADKKIRDYGVVTEVPLFTDDYTFVWINGGYDDNNKYISRINILDKNYKIVDEVKTDKISLQRGYNDNKLYYLVGGREGLSELPAEIIEYDLKTRKERVFYYDNDIRVYNFFFESGLCYLIYYDKDDGINGPFRIGIFDGKNIKQIKTNSKQIDVLDTHFYQRDNGIIIMQMSVEGTKTGYLRLHKGKAYEHYNLCDTVQVTFGKNYFYCENSVSTATQKNPPLDFFKVNLDTGEKIAFELPFPSKEEQNDYTYTFFD